MKWLARMVGVAAVLLDGGGLRLILAAWIHCLRVCFYHVVSGDGGGGGLVGYNDDDDDDQVEDQSEVSPPTRCAGVSMACSLRLPLGCGGGSRGPSLSTCNCTRVTATV